VIRYDPLLPLLGRNLPVNFVEIDRRERPLLRKADVQFGILKACLANGWIGPNTVEQLEVDASNIVIIF